jgi:type III restriction enzyme
LELKEYQVRVLERFDEYLDELCAQRAKTEKIIAANQLEDDPELLRPVPDYPAKTWAFMKDAQRLPSIRAAIPYSPREDGAGRNVPSVCFKIPTAGGKTLLAAEAISHFFGKYLKSNTGLVLWIAPNEAIYTQTKKALSNRQHPYRQLLDRAAAGRVKIIEKDSRLDARDIESNLCIILLMLQSANRETQETLRLFRDRGNVHGFFPREDDFKAHAELLNEIPNLDVYGDPEIFGAIVKDSLGNVLRRVRPMVIVDEGQKAYSILALKTLYGFNPCFVLELSATPKDRPRDHIFSNWLVDVRGTDLDKEGMVKLPINVEVKAGDDWRNCVRESLDKLDALQSAADRLQGETARYIRPIMLIQVERTGAEQRDSGLIHSEDVRDYLLQVGLRAEEIAVKTSEKNELTSPENIDLLSPTCRIRAIITKQALQEGWDCPFAYILCSLSASRGEGAMTQLVGRILRQPDTVKTNIPVLDECYVYCLHGQTGQVITAIKDGLEKEGLADLAMQIREPGSGASTNTIAKRKVQRRDEFRKLEVFLPVVNWCESDTSRPLDYEQDILLDLDWPNLKLDPLIERLSPHVQIIGTQVFRISVADEGAIQNEAPIQIADAASFDTLYATRVISDIIPNPFIARECVGRLLSGLTEKGFDEDRLGALSGYILEELRKHLLDERDRLSEARFFELVGDGKIQFQLKTDRKNWSAPMTLETTLPLDSPQLIRATDGQPVEKSLFSPVYQADYNNEEKEFACYVDQQAALTWWHRNVAQAGHYFLQGWKKQKVYPDFLLAMSSSDAKPRLMVLETKGDHLEGNKDTEYKRKLMQTLTTMFQTDVGTKAGELHLVGSDVEVVCDLVLMSEWKNRIHEIGFN